MRERLADECASCKAIVYVKQSLNFYQESFCATCRIAIALENIIELMEVVIDGDMDR